MTPEARQKLRALLVDDEKLKNFPYTDTRGNITIGIGRCLTTRGISNDESFYLLNDDIMYFSNKLSHVLPFWDMLNENRQIALINMCFNLGVQGLLEFHDTLNALNRGDYLSASEEMLKSSWVNEVGERAIRLAHIIKTGELP